MPKVQSNTKSAFWYFSGNLAPVPKTAPVGDPGPMFKTAGLESG